MKVEYLGVSSDADDYYAANFQVTNDPGPDVTVRLLYPSPSLSSGSGTSEPIQNQMRSSLTSYLFVCKCNSIGGCVRMSTP